MLYLNPPYFLIDGVSIFPDHADPLQFYYLPMMPHLSTVTNTVTGVAEPQMQLIEYTGQAGSGGFINFDCNIGVGQDVLDTVAQKLQQQANLSDLARLSPVTFVDGTVKLLILGAESPDTTVAGAPTAGTTAAAGAAAPAAGPRFVTKIQGSTKPALFGDNQASFSVQLDQYGATVLEQALNGVISPIAVIYSLDFVALRPAFRVHLSVDWNRVQTHLDDSFSGGFLFFSADIEKEVDKLIESRVIDLQVDTFVTDADGGKPLSDDRDRAVSEVYDMIKSTFFESSLPPPTPGQPDDISKAEGAFKTVSAMAVTGGAASLACFSHKSVDLTRIDQKSLNVNISERTSVRRTIYPQGHLSGILAELAGQDMSRFITKVDLDNPWFQRRQLKVVTYADFDNDQIASIDVNLTYNGLVKSVSLTKASPSDSVDWTSVLTNGAMVRPVTYTYTVNFAGVDTTQRPGQMTSAELTEIGDVLSLQPRGSLYSNTVVPIRADTLPWDRYGSVEVACRYDDDVNKVHDSASAVLTSAAAELNWPMFLIDPSQRSFSYQLVFGMTSGGSSTTPWLTTDAGRVDVNDPFPPKTQLMVMAAVDWSVTDQVLVHVAYPGKVNPVSEKNYIFNATNSAVQTFIPDGQDAAHSAVYYEARIIGKNGKIWTVPGSVTSDSSLLISLGMPGHQIITARTEAVDFAAAQVTSVGMQMRYVDQANKISVTDAFNLASSGDAHQFAFDYFNPAIAAEYSADVQMVNGQTHSIDWSPVSGDAVTVTLSGLA